MPPSVQLENKRPRHPDRALDSRQLAANCSIDVPDDEAGYEDD